MHDESREKVIAFVDNYLRTARGKKLEIVDVGARVVDEDHAAFRKLLAAPGWRYRGLDVTPGPNVDIVVANPYRWDEIAADSVDLVVSGQAFEHIPYFWITAFEIGRILRPGGLALLIAPSRGFEHRFPVDCWRFYRDGMQAIAAFLGFTVIESFTDWDRSFWGDSLLVMQKPIWDTAQRQEFARRRELQQGVLTGGEVHPCEPVEPTAASPLAGAVPGLLWAGLEQVRLRDIADFEASQAAQAAGVRSATAADLPEALRDLAKQIAGRALALARPRRGEG